MMPVHCWGCCELVRTSTCAQARTLMHTLTCSRLCTHCVDDVLQQVSSLGVAIAPEPGQTRVDGSKASVVYSEWATASMLHTC